MSHLYILIGGNQGDRQQTLTQTADLIRERIGSVVACSHIYETAPWGDFDTVDTKAFLNMALVMDTILPPLQCLEECQMIEHQMGRRRQPDPHDGQRIYHSRPIDIDLIFYDHAVVATPRLTLPHPRMHMRRFVLEPMCEIAPSFIHPLFNKTIQQLLSECTDPSSCCYFGSCQQ